MSSENPSDPPPPEDPAKASTEQDDDSIEAWKNWFGSVAKSTLDQTKSTLESVKRDFNELGDSVANQDVVSKAGEFGKATTDFFKKQAHAVSNLVSVEAEDLYEEPIPAADFVKLDDKPVVSQPDAVKAEQPIKESSETPKADVPKSKSTSSGVWSLFGGEDKPADGETAKQGSSWWSSITEKASKIIQDIDDSVAQNLNEENGPSGNQPDDKSKPQEKDWLDSLTETVGKAFYMEDTTKNEENETVPLAISKSGRQINLPANRLFALQNDVATYLDEPRGAPELYDDWLDNFEINEYGESIEDLMQRKPQVRHIYAKIVPNQISSDQFWAHYFYRLHQLELDEATKNMIRSAVVDANIEKGSGSPKKEGIESPLSDQWSVCSGEAPHVASANDSENEKATSEDRKDNKTPTKEEAPNDWEEAKFSDSD